jgi:hypothetical protein
MAIAIDIEAEVILFFMLLLSNYSDCHILGQNLARFG